MDVIFKLGEQVEMEQMFRALEKCGMDAEKYRIETLMNYLDGMEGTVRSMAEELREVREEFSEVREKGGFSGKAEVVCDSSENGVNAVRERIAEAQQAMLASARNAVNAFEEKGEAALRRAVSAIKLPEILTSLEGALGNGKEVLVRSAERLEEAEREFREAKTHRENAYGALRGKKEGTARGTVRGYWRSSGMIC